jgi:FtsP/CotA-like multicopper oxidase with cupredoxin domain
MMGNGGGMSSASARPPFDAFTVNGKAYSSAAPLAVSQGERVRLRLINANATDTQVFALAGHRLAVTHSDGNPLPKPSTSMRCRLASASGLTLNSLQITPVDGSWRRSCPACRTRARWST